MTQHEREAIMHVLDRAILSGGSAPAAAAFEQAFAKAVGARFAVLTASGTAALQVAIGALGLRAGDEVLVPAYSFVATAIAPLLVGAVPVFVDVDREHGLMDLALTEAAITPRTRAIMPVHVHGCPFDVDAFSDLARRHGLALVEDAAQAHLATYRGRPVGALGRGGGFSLQSSKNLSAGEGGVFVTNEPELAEAANRLRNFGQNVSLSDAAAYDPSRALDGHRPLSSETVGSMLRGNEMMAAFADAQLSMLPERTRRCQRNADRLFRALSELPGVLPPRIPDDRTSVHHKVRIRLDPRAAGLDVSKKTLREITMAALRAEGLEVVLWQTESLPAQPLFRERVGYGQGFPFSSTSGGTDLARNYDPSRYPATQELLDGSIVLFSQTCPLIAQDDSIVDRYIEAFAKVWAHRHEIVRARA